MNPMNVLFVCIIVLYFLAQLNVWLPITFKSLKIINDYYSRFPNYVLGILIGFHWILTDKDNFLAGLPRPNFLKKYFNNNHVIFEYFANTFALVMYSILWTTINEKLK